MRESQSFAIIIWMVYQCLNKLVPFLVYFFLTVFTFSLMLMNTDAYFSEESINDYNKMFKYFLTTYRNVIGDV